MGDGVEVAKATLIGTDAALSLFVASAPLLSAELVAPLNAVLRKGVPVLGNALAGVLHTVAAACQRLRLQQTLIFVMLHGAFTYACGDAFAQAVSSQPPAAAAGKKSVVRTMRWQPLRTARAAVAGLAADAIPFYYWGAALQQLPEMAWVRWLLRVARIPERAVPAALISLKIGLHTALFQPVTTAAIMLLQALLRRDSWADACDLVRRRYACCAANPRPSLVVALCQPSLAAALYRGGPHPDAYHRCGRFKAAFLVAASTFAVGGVLVYSLSSVALQSALRNMGVLGYAVYMAVLSNS